MEKNNLDNLFKEKFRDFSETPDEKVWENISSSLDRRKKKRVIPIWWQLGGAAAAVALLLLLANPFVSDEDSTTPTVVDIEQKVNDIEPENTDKNILKGDSKTQIVTNDNEVEKEEDNNRTKASANGNEDANNHSLIPERKQSSSQSNIAIARTANREQEVTKDLGNEQHQKDFNALPTQDKTDIAVNTGEQKEQDVNKTTLNQNISEADESEKVVVAENTVEEDKKSIYDAIAEQEELEKDALAENTSGKKWTMGPSIAPVFFSSLGEGSPIHSNFARNSKSGNLNLSYGMAVSYQISDKLSVRSGIHRVDFGYDTNDIVFTSSLTTSTSQLIDNITYSQTSRNLVVESKTNETASFTSNSAVGGGAQPFEGNMVQQLGYIEVPMELKYALVDKKFGVNLIGGFSSLFLLDNAVSLESDQLITEMGSANNANDINFSTNVGIGFNYQISQKLQFNVEPMFKYQLNTFSDSVGNFMPYSVGVYSGLNFKF